MLIKDENYIYAVDENDMTDEIRDALNGKPQVESGYGVRLKSDYTWELYELPIVAETETTYTAEQLEAMTSTELREICAELGISGTMTKANMISLILGKQNET